VGIAFGVAAERASSEESDLALVVADFVVGSVLLVCGVVAWSRRPESRVGALMSLAGFTWFLGTLFEPALYLHRGPLVHLLLSYPTGQLATLPARAVVAVAYVDATIEPLAGNDWLTLALGGGVAAAALYRFHSVSGPARRAARLALGAVLAIESVLVLGAVGRVAGWDADRAVLWGYDLVIASATIVLVFDLLRARWTEAVVTGLVVDLGARVGSGPLRARLARALGDPSLVVGYRVPGTGALVDEAGGSVRLPSPGSGRAVTSIEDRGVEVAVLIHDEALLADRKLLESVGTAARFAVANAGLQAEARARAGDIEKSRRRIVEAADSQRRRLGRELHLGAERRLDRVEALLAEARTMTAEVDRSPIQAFEVELGEARRELQEFAHGVHPAPLTEGGLVPALVALAARSSVPATVEGQVERLPESVEAALYFVCSEALTNTVKHAVATGVRIEVRSTSEGVAVSIQDDGIGGAEPGRGSGLQGLADRAEALGGRLTVASPPGRGTRVVAELPRTATSERARATSRPGPN
jgi:signal transduction histidine kinase